MDWISSKLESLKKELLFRERVISDNYLDLCSNDYLGLRKNKEVIKAGITALEMGGSGAGASQLISGYTIQHKRLEEKLALFKEIPSCVLFGSGYLANLGLIPVLAEEGDLILSDEFNHASIVDGCKLSAAEKKIFEHLNYKQVETILERKRKYYKKVVIITDSVFSMEGDLANLMELSRLSDKYETILYIDDAHATGVVGKGKGSLQEFGIKWKENIIIMGTLSKALGCYGAFVCGSYTLISYVVNRARSLIFSTSLPPSICASALKAIEIIEKNPQIISDLKERAEKTYNFLKESHINTLWHKTPILPIIIGNEGKAFSISHRLKEKGILLRAIRYPAVPKGKARLRLTVSLGIEEENWFKALEEVINTIKQAS